jgi:hypothetical protein
MNRERVIWHLENWCEYLKADNHKLGYPTKSLMIASGGASGGDAFEIMCDDMDITNARAIDAIIDDLKPPYKTAIYHQWLKNKFFWPTHELDYEIALETIMKVADRKGII